MCDSNSFFVDATNFASGVTTVFLVDAMGVRGIGGVIADAGGCPLRLEILEAGAIGIVTLGAILGGLLRSEAEASTYCRNFLPAGRGLAR